MSDRTGHTGARSIQGLLTLDTIRDIKLYQSKGGYRFSVDALLLFSFVNVVRVKRVADIGAGSGVIGLLLARKYRSAHVTLIELQDSLVDLALRNVSLNSLDGRVDVMRLDVKALGSRGTAAGGDRLLVSGPVARNVAGETSVRGPAAGSFDLVISNPPFRKAMTGRLSEGDERALARHEIAVTLADVVCAASLLLRHHGRFCIIHLPERLPDVIELMRAHALEAKRARFVHSRLSSEAKMVLVEAVKGGRGGLKVEKPLCIYDEDGVYSEEMRALYRS
ncbi:MAG: tRNA1(Val) (adenine(37)-N6)-methyltransferase [Chloroflexota bacterium]